MGLINKLSFTASGGEFSHLSERPSHQDQAVGHYVTSQIPDSYPITSIAPRRGIPHISALTTDFPTMWEDLVYGIGGTSASTPLWAAIVTLLNDYEALKGRGPLGFINPWLYNLPKGALHDITTGGNHVGRCDRSRGCKLKEKIGYDVARGWDPVTGLGSPVFAALTDALDLQAAKR